MCLNLLRTDPSKLLKDPKKIFPGFASCVSAISTKLNPFCYILPPKHLHCTESVNQMFYYLLLIAKFPQVDNENPYHYTYFLGTAALELKFQSNYYPLWLKAQTLSVLELR